MNPLSKVLDIPAVSAASRLLGAHLIRTIDGNEVICRVVETEAYEQTDPASHSYKGRTPRTAITFGPAGYAYVYFNYGMHYAFNVVVGPDGHAGAVLIRAVEPISGLEIIKANRPRISELGMLTNGPGKLCQALAIGRELNAHDLSKEPLRLLMQPALDKAEISVSPRIGISKATELEWRFFIKDNPYVSGYRRSAL